MITDYHIFASQEFLVHSAPNKPLADLIMKTQLDSSVLWLAAAVSSWAL